MVKHVQKLSLLLIAFVWLATSSQVFGQVNLAGGVYQENFDGMGASGTTLPAGWAAVRLGGSGPANEALSPIVSDGNASSGAVYNVGAANSTERALGSLSSGTTAAAFGVQFRNTSGSQITRLEVAAVMEQWKSGSRSDQFESLVFEYSTDATSLSSGTWTGISSLNLVEKLTTTAAAEPVNGNADANRTAISGTLSLPLADQATIWFRWKDTDVIGSDGMYAVDDFVITPSYTIVDNTAPILNATTPANGATNVSTQLDLVLQFNEPVIAGTGQVTLSWAGGSLSRSASDPSILYNGNTVTIQGLSLNPGLIYTGTIENTAFKDFAGNFFGGLSGSAYSFTTSTTGTPVISTNKDVLSFTSIQTGMVSAMQSYEVSGQYLQGDVIVSVTGPYQISKSNEAASFGTADVVFTPAELASAKPVYVRFAPTATTNNSGTITQTTTGAQPVSLNLNGIAYSVLVQDFNTCSSTLPGGWAQYSVTGNQTWSCTTFGRNGNAVQMSGFAGGNQPNEDWLISPSLNLASGFNYPLLSFWSRTAFAGDPLKLMVSVNYSGTGSPHAPGVVWTEVNGRFPAAQTDNWTLSENIDLSGFKAANVHVAFVYVSTSAAAPRWTIDDIEITNSTTVPPAALTSSLNPLSDADFGIVTPGAVVDKTFTFAVQSLYSTLTLEVPAPFSLSKNGTDFAQSISYTAAEGASNTFTVRFTAPAQTGQAYASSVRFQAENLNQTAGYLTGAVLNKDNTFDVVTWNIEWFGAPNQGPGNEVLQRTNVKKVIDALDADVYAFQEISNVTAFDDLKALLPDYEGFMSSYSGGSQEIAYLYKKSTVTKISQRTLLTNASSDRLFWASGRFPYLLEVDATVNGVTKRLHLINVHAKANDNGSPEEALTAYNRRLEDVRVLKDSLDFYFPNANIIMLGDYNDDIDQTVADITSTTASTYRVFVDDAARYSFPTLSLSQAGLRSYITRDNVIDHIMISNELANFYVSNSARIDIPFEVIESASADVYASTTSDHLPTIARFVLRDPNGTEEESRQAGFSLYPNPTTGSATFKLPANTSQTSKITLTVYGLRGEMLLKMTGTEEQAQENLSQKLKTVSAGLYLVRVQAGGKTYQSRIIKN